MPTGAYDPHMNQISIGSYPVTNGVAAGTFIKASRKTDSFKSDVGAFGDVVVSHSHDERGDIEITVQRTSSLNDFLSSLMAKHEQFGTGIVAITIKDLNGTTKVFGAECWPVKYPDVEEAVEAQNRVWKFEVAHLQIKVGGENT